MILLTDSYGEWYEEAPEIAEKPGLLGEIVWAGREGFPPQLIYYTDLKEACNDLDSRSCTWHPEGYWVVDCTERGCVASTAYLHYVDKGDVFKLLLK